VSIAHVPITKKLALKIPALPLIMLKLIDHETFEIELVDRKVYSVLLDGPAVAVADWIVLKKLVGKVTSTGAEAGASPPIV
jgi:hypothetical protein